ncbi:PQQ-dependent sugar dehydrogenase [Nocardioides islandensis]|jgi:glucose/arabinose dehydrogenase|uniref:PQQ-dependent sugar dehydrogenase n=1 Tax=Nocardioides islandensis TaxID=433663 RepID=A0A930YKB3_9ACTN|nr:PQQ-dependent sugar dehydrogenase [Nocardioides islandensis]MBF4765884.1 PQQ-dependent sugar dehydrogenase [Nocardioides islandensis]
MTRLLAAVLALVLLPGVACSSAAEPDGSAPAAASSSTTTARPTSDAGDATSDDSGQSRAKGVTLKVTRLATGLDHPWDVHGIGNGRYLVTERSGHLTVIDKDGTVRRLSMPTDLIWVSGETGLMGLAIDPDFASNGRFYTCNGGLPQGNPDVRVMVWTLNKAATRATYRDTLIKGFPTSSGRHGGCRLLILENGAMLVGTGDAAIGTNPENKQSLGGKTLMLNRITGKPWPTNPYANVADRRQKFLHTWGHRNVQGLAQRADGSLWSVEHGPDRDDEVNLLKNGGDYGWNPVPGYNESVPMTDQSLPGKQIEAKWSSGFPTVATSGASFVYGGQWGWYDGTLAVAALKAGELLFMKFDASGKLLGVRTPAAMKKYGRLRAVTALADGSILVTTDNGGNDAVLRVRPAG